MTTDRETTRIVRSWLRTNEHESADRVLDAVLDQLDTTPQRRAGWPAWRTPTMNRFLTIGLGAAAVVVLLLVGSQFFGSSSTNVGGPDPESTPTLEPTPTPSAEPTPTSTPQGLLPEGPHVLTDGDIGGMRNVPITVTIPGPGWYGIPGDGILSNSPPERNFAPQDAGMIGPFVGDIYVPADPCEWTTTMPDTPATTVDEVVAALQAQPSRDASEPVDITVDGHAGKSITLHVAHDALLDECDQGQFCTLTQDDPTVCHRYQQFQGQIDEMWILDVDGEVAVIDATWGDEAPAEAVAELRAILESMTFD